MKSVQFVFAATKESRNRFRTYRQTDRETLFPARPILITLLHFFPFLPPGLIICWFDPRRDRVGNSSALRDASLDRNSLSLLSGKAVPRLGSFVSASFSIPLPSLPPVRQLLDGRLEETNIRPTGRPPKLLSGLKLI